MKEKAQLKKLEKIMNKSDLADEEKERILSEHKKTSETMHKQMDHQKQVQVLVLPYYSLFIRTIILYYVLLSPDKVMKFISGGCKLI